GLAGEPPAVSVDRGPGGRAENCGGVAEGDGILAAEHRPPVRGGPSDDPLAGRVPQHDDHRTRGPVPTVLFDHGDLLPPDAEGAEGADERDALVIDDELTPGGDHQEKSADQHDDQAQQSAQHTSNGAEGQQNYPGAENDQQGHAHEAPEGTANPPRPDRSVAHLLHPHCPSRLCYTRHPTGRYRLVGTSPHVPRAPTRLLSRHTHAQGTESHMNFWGADTDQLREHGTAVSSGARRIEELIVTLSSTVESVQWIGPDADEFRSSFQVMCGERVDPATSRLFSLAKECEQHSEEQDSA